MKDYLAINAIIDGIIYSDNGTKQDLGRRFAVRLGLNPGPPGADGGIDGEGFCQERKIYFQSKLSREPLGANIADIFYAQLDTHRADVGILLSGVGYTSGFQPRFKTHSDCDRFIIHLLKLEDIFVETPTFAAAVTDLPPLRELAAGEWKEF